MSATSRPSRSKYKADRFARRHAAAAAMRNVAAATKPAPTSSSPTEPTTKENDQ